MTTWQLVTVLALLLIAAAEAYNARMAVNRLARQVDRMHGHLLKLLAKQGVDPLE